MGQKGLITRMVVLGRIGAPHGIKGFAHVHSFAMPPENILTYKNWYLQVKDQWQAIVLLEFRAQGKGFVALFQGFESREAVATLTHCELGVPRETLPVLEKDQYYWSDLIGLTVITETGEVLGTLESFIETGSNDVLVVKGESKEHLIPYSLNDYVLDVDQAARIIRVAWDPEF